MSKRVLKEDYRRSEVEREWKGGENSVVGRGPLRLFPGPAKFNQ
jgi:hypothetical protein